MQALVVLKYRNISLSHFILKFSSYLRLISKIPKARRVRSGNVNV